MPYLPMTVVRGLLAVTGALIAVTVALIAIPSLAQADTTQPTPPTDLGITATVKSTGAPNVGTETFTASEQPGQQIELFIDGKLAKTSAGSSGFAQLTATGLTPGAHTAYVETLSGGVASAPSQTVTFVTWPQVDGQTGDSTSTPSYNGRGVYANSTTPTITVSDVAADASTVTLDYESKGCDGTASASAQVATHGKTSVAIKLPQDMALKSKVSDGCYWVTQTVDGVESGASDSDFEGAPVFGISGVDPTPATVYQTFQVPAGDSDAPHGVETTNPTPSFSFDSNEDKNNNTFEGQFTISQNGRTILTSATVAVGRNWTVPQALPIGTYTITAATVDSFGDVGSSSKPLTFTVATPVSSTQINGTVAAAVGAVHGNGATTAAILKQNAFTFTLNAPAAGRVWLNWWHVVGQGGTLICSYVGTVKQGSNKITLALTKAGRKLLNSSQSSTLLEQDAYWPLGASEGSKLKTVTLQP